MQLSFDTMYRALCDKDAAYEGLFLTGVKTTGIFCRTTCTARKPKPENVEFFPDAAAAMAKGYRACKVCRPLEYPDATPPYIRSLLDELAADPSLKLRAQDLRNRGLEPATVTRWFRKHHGTTFVAYQRLQRINYAFKRLDKGHAVTDTALESGFESLSGFNDSFKAVFGTPPSRRGEVSVVDLQRIETRLGTMIACATAKGICLLEFSERKMLETEFRQISRHFGAVIAVGENPHIALLERELHSYFEGTLRDFTVPLDPVGTEFQRKVWDVLRGIPYGQTRSYAEQAQLIGQPTAVRAVATANGMNKIAIVIPCHRVIGKDGKLVGYAGGLHRKQYLLDLERGITPLLADR